MTSAGDLPRQIRSGVRRTMPLLIGRLAELVP